jgi:hypothetical protein
MRHRLTAASLLALVMVVATVGGLTAAPGLTELVSVRGNGKQGTTSARKPARPR